MRSAIARTAKGYLHHPTLGAALGRIIQKGFLVKREECLLDNLLCLTSVVQYSECDSEDQPCIASVEQIEAFRIFGLHPGHQLFITGRTDLCRLWPRDTTFLPSPPHNGECQCAPIRRRAHVRR